MDSQSGVAIAPRRLGHLNLFVTDVERSANFYSEVCGFREVFREPGISMIFMSNGNTHHDLGLMEITSGQRIGKDGHVQVASGNGRTAGLNHLGFEMQTEEQLVQAFRRAKSAGVRISRTTDHQIAHSIYMNELNGHTLEFYADVVEDWQHVYATSTGQLISGHWDPDAAEPLKTRMGPVHADMFRSDTAILPSRNVAYAALPVKDLDSSVAYYADVLGLHLKLIDRAAKFAVMCGTAESGCDVCLVQTTNVPASRLFFGGVQMHQGQPIKQGFEWLSRRGIPAALVGDEDNGALVVTDPDQIPLVYSTRSALDLMAEFGLEIVATTRKLTPSLGDAAN